jgi:hypothetical protein
MDAKAGTSTVANTSAAGYWKRIAIAAEALAGQSSVAASTLAGSQLRAAKAFEIIGGTQAAGASANRSRSGYIKRIVTALDAKNGAPTVGSLGKRFKTGLSTYAGVPGGGSQASLYLGNVATKVAIPSALNGTNRQFNSRKHHYMRDNVTQIKIRLPNWYWARGASGLEVAGTGTIGYEAAIEYPEGVYTRVTFAGVNAGVATGGNEVESDWCNVAIPKGAGFWVRVFANASHNIVFNAGIASPVTDQADEALGDAMEFAVSGVTNKVMGGTITPTVTNASSPIFGPVAILAMTREPTVFIDGDSREWGLLETYGNAGDLDGDRGVLAKIIGPSFGYINAGGSGDSYQAWLTSNTRRLALASYCSHVFLGKGVNDMRVSGSGLARSSAAVLADQQTAIGLYAGKTILVKTIEPSSNGTFADLAGQTVDAGTANIQAFNVAQRAKPTGVSVCFDVASAVEAPTAAGKWVPNYTSDGLHHSAASHAAIKAANVINPALITRT